MGCRTGGAVGQPINETSPWFSAFIKDFALQGGFSVQIMPAFLILRQCRAVFGIKIAGIFLHGKLAVQRDKFSRKYFPGKNRLSATPKAWRRCSVPVFLFP